MSTASSGITGSRFAEGICTSSTPPLEVSSEEGACVSFRVLLVLTLCLALIGARGATGSGAGLFLEADDGKSGCLCVVIFAEFSGLESPRLDCVSSLELSSMEVYKKEGVSKHKHVCRSP